MTKNHAYPDSCKGDQQRALHPAFYHPDKGLTTYCRAGFWVLPTLPQQQWFSYLFSIAILPGFFLPRK